jgi:hypothetical protein
MNNKRIAEFLIVNAVALITTVAIHQPSLTKSNNIDSYLNSEVKHTPIYATINSSDLTHPQIFLETNRGNYNLTIQKHPKILAVNVKALREALEQIGKVLPYLPDGLEACIENEYCKGWLPTLGIGGGILGVGYIIVALIDNNNAS